MRWAEIIDPRPVRRVRPGRVAVRRRRREKEKRATSAPSTWREKKAGEAPRERRGDVPLFYRLVYRLVRRIPRGKIVTYGQVAAILGQPRGARAVGMALGALTPPLADELPWHRVINAAGRPSHRDGFWAAIQREILEAEGVEFDRRGHVDLKRVRWKGPRRECVTGLRRTL